MKIKDDPNDYLTIPEVAAYFRISRSQVYKLAKKPSFPAVKLGKQWRINKEELNKWFVHSAYSNKYSVLP